MGEVVTDGRNIFSSLKRRREVHDLARTLFEEHEIIPLEPVRYASDRILSSYIGITNGDAFPHIHVFPDLGRVLVTDSEYESRARRLVEVLEAGTSQNFTLEIDYDKNRIIQDI